MPSGKSNMSAVEKRACRLVKMSSKWSWHFFIVKTDTHCLSHPNHWEGRKSQKYKEMFWTYILLNYKSVYELSETSQNIFILQTRASILKHMNADPRHFMIIIFDLKTNYSITFFYILYVPTWLNIHRSRFSLSLNNQLHLLLLNVMERVEMSKTTFLSSLDSLFFW